MTQTKNYGLHKADPDEYYDINITNENFDTIDEVLKTATDSALNANKKADELEIKLETTKADIGTINNQAAKVQYDVAEIIFQMSIRDMTDNSKFKNVIVDNIDSVSAVNLITGSYTTRKVYI